MGTSADVPFHPEHPYEPPYDRDAYRRIAALEAELERVRQYSLCMEGLTVRAFIDGVQCLECGMGAEHAAALEHADGA